MILRPSWKDFCKGNMKFIVKLYEFLQIFDKLFEAKV